MYAPFHLSQTIPTMLGAHLLVAGVVEFVLTVGVIAYLQRANLPILRINHPGVPDAADRAHWRRRPRRRARPRLRGILIGLGALVALVPLGLLASGGAFGEDGPSNLDLKQYGLDAVPTGLQKYSDFWSSALLPGYDVKHGSPAEPRLLRVRHHRHRRSSSAWCSRRSASPPCRGAGAAAATVTARTPTSNATRPACDGHRRRRDDRDRRAPLARVAVAGRDRTVPVWLRRKAATRWVRGEDPPRGVRAASAARCSPTTSPRTPGLLQRLDARVKVLTLLGLLVVAAFVALDRRARRRCTSSPSRSRRRAASPSGSSSRGCGSSCPIFTGIVVLPATLNLVTPGTIVVPLGHWFGDPVGLTAEGLESAGLIVMRVAASISLVVLLTLTTPWTRLLHGLPIAAVADDVDPRAGDGVPVPVPPAHLGRATCTRPAVRAPSAPTAIWRTGGGSSRRRPGHSSGRRTGSRKRCTWRWWPGGSPGTSGCCAPDRVKRRDLAWCLACCAIGLLLLWGDHVLG